MQSIYCKYFTDQCAVSMLPEMSDIKFVCKNKDDC